VAYIATTVRCDNVSVRVIGQQVAAVLLPVLNARRTELVPGG